MKTIKIFVALLLTGIILGGCASHKESVSEPVKAYRPPQAHIELHKRLLSQQKQLMFSNKDSHDLTTEDYEK
ncbi:hypothetical protein [Bacteroides acidifaciens]|jgi:PBP1b-binding outer membrane lipoprotein LpoB|uniref:hypothetical protein n=1 Tax=Bacteroides acidifaciens TaxID=85831 RepID=UPI00256FA854|nr:hypothetical protein [Bacteroides acidifaciens]